MPNDIPPERLEAALALAAEGKFTRQIIAALGISPRTYSRWIQNDAAFRQAIAQARAIGRDIIAESLATITDEDPFGDANILRIKSDNVKWLLSCQEPVKYGLRQTLTVESVSIGDAITEAKTRALRVINPPDPGLLEAPNPFD